MNQRDTFSRIDAALLVLLAVLVAIFFWRILTPNPADRAQFPPGDFTDQFYAFRVYEARAFAEGRIPLWSENFNSGHPFLADIQSAVFYPIALVNTLVNVWLFSSFSLFALELEALLHFYLAGAFTYVFARRVLSRPLRVSAMITSFDDSIEETSKVSVRIARVGAFTSAIVFMFGGYLTSYPSLQLAILETAVWLPLALYCLERATETERPTPNDKRRTTNNKRLIAWLIGAGLVLGVAALAGHPQTFLFVVAVSVIYFVWRSYQARAEAMGDTRYAIRKRRYLMRVAAQIGLPFLIAFGVAAVQLIPAIEYQQLSTREALSFADAAAGFPTLDVLQFILPGFASAFASPLYIGILPLWLAIFALVRRRTGDGGRPNGLSERAFWGLLALVSLILSFGFYVFAYAVIYLFVPGAALFREQERLAFVVSFALAMLAGYGITDLFAEAERKRAHKLYALLPFGAALMFALLITFFVAGAQNSDGRLSFLGDRAGLMLVLFGLSSLVLGLYLRNIISLKWFVPLAIVLILFDAWSVEETSNKGQAQDRFGDNALIDQVKQDTGIFRVAAAPNIMPGHFGIMYDVEEVGGISPLRLANYDRLLALPSNVSAKLLNVKYLLTNQPAADTTVVLQSDGNEVLGRNQVVPRAWMVGDAQVIPNDSAQFEQLAAGLDVAQTALVSSPLPFALDANASQGTLRFGDRGAERLALDVNTPADGLLILSENYFPGWRATVDGQSVEILRADLSLRAVPIRAGQHHVEMWYEPLSFRIGAVLSALTVIGCIAALGALKFLRE